MKRLSMVIAAAAALLAGCADGSPTGLDSGMAPRGAANHSATMVGAADARLAIDDVLDRVLPALADQADGRQVAAALRGLQQALASGRASEGPALASAAQAAVERYASLENGDAAEVDAIRLALATVIGTN